MDSTKTRRRIRAALAMLSTVAFLAVAAPAFAGGGCTERIHGYTNLTVHAGEVVCGGGTDDHVDYVEAGGTFNGGAGEDSVVESWGTFNGGAGADEVWVLHEGTFDGNSGADYVQTMNGGVFDGASGDDHVGVMYGGSFDGASGTDWVSFQYGGTSTP